MDRETLRPKLLVQDGEARSMDRRSLCSRDRVRICWRTMDWAVVDSCFLRICRLEEPQESITKQMTRLRCSSLKSRPKTVPRKRPSAPQPLQVLILSTSITRVIRSCQIASMKRISELMKTIWSMRCISSRLRRHKRILNSTRGLLIHTKIRKCLMMSITQEVGKSMLSAEVKWSKRDEIHAKARADRGSMKADLSVGHQSLLGHDH